MSHQMSGISRKTFERDPKTLARVRTPAGRALALAAWALASIVIVSGFAAGSTLIVVAGLVAWIPAMGVVNMVAGGVTAMRGSELDERELAIRERALADAHRFVGVLLVCGMVLATLLASDSVSKDTALAVLSALLLVQLGSAPIAVALRTALPERR
jgi:hypothetical protein